MLKLKLTSAIVFFSSFFFKRRERHPINNDTESRVEAQGLRGCLPACDLETSTVLIHRSQSVVYRARVHNFSWITCHPHVLRRVLYFSHYSTVHIPTPTCQL